ncbi:hypothetical protein [Saccharopolyspora hattusasensis]|uniref:hypothetical protein n=1 Tax=Saccharopolyspora hattusasensis TaxID=1128679 RepID=UPI003D989CB1
MAPKPNPGAATRRPGWSNAPAASMPRAATADWQQAVQNALTGPDPAEARHRAVGQLQ